MLPCFVTDKSEDVVGCHFRPQKSNHNSNLKRKRHSTTHVHVNERLSTTIQRTSKLTVIGKVPDVYLVRRLVCGTSG
jgi:hypothetical protein